MFLNRNVENTKIDGDCVTDLNKNPPQMLIHQKIYYFK